MKVYQHLKEYGILFGLMFVLNVIGRDSRYLQYATVVLIAGFIFRFAQRQGFLISSTTWIIVLMHPIVHANTMYNEKLYQSNITLDLCVHALTALLSWIEYQKHHAFTQGYLLVTFLGCLFAAGNAYFVQVPTSGVHTQPWINIFPTLSVIHFSIVNIFRDPILFGTRFLFEAGYTLLFFVLLVRGVIPVHFFQQIQYAENYFLCVLFAATITSSKQNVTKSRTLEWESQQS